VNPCRIVYLHYELMPYEQASCRM